MPDKPLKIAVLAVFVPVRPQSIGCDGCQRWAVVKLSPPNPDEWQDLQSFEFCLDCASEFLAEIAVRATESYQVDGFTLQLGSELDGGAPRVPGSPRQRRTHPIEDRG